MTGEKLAWSILLISLLDNIMEDFNVEGWAKWLIMLAPILMWNTFSQLVTSIESALSSITLDSLLGS